MFGFLKEKVKQFFKKEEAVLESRLAEQPAQPVDVKPISEAPSEKALEAEEKPVSMPAPEVREIERESEGIEILRPPEPKHHKKEEAMPLALEKRDVRVKAEEEKRDLAPKLSLGTRLKRVVLRKAEIRDKDVESLLIDFNIALLESDVSLPVADELCANIKRELVGKEISSSDDVRKVSGDAIKSSLLKVLEQDKIDVLSRAKSKKPFVILFLGPNGHGKSTTIGKFATYMQKNGLSCVVSASDTFRAAAIEQLSTIAAKAGARFVKHKYGADPAAVAFDAVEYAKSHALDVVLIDTAGRSELNVNLMEQLKKIVRVAKPDMKIYVGEALAGNAAVEEAQRFNELINIDGIIVTKVDCDVKGGSLLSMAHVTGRPVLFVGTGQSLDDLEPFDRDWFVSKIIG